MPYEPQEDSFLLKEFVKRYAKGVVLDMGTGSGLQAREAAHSKKTTKVFAVDVDPEAIRFAKKHADGRRHKKIKWVVGDLFSPFKNKKYLHYFDTITFNPPYLPQDSKVRDIALEGGKRGHETIERFLSQAQNYLKPTGILLLVFSSLTPRVHDLIQQHLFVGKELGRKHIFFEDIFVYLLRPNPVFSQLEKKGICNIKYFAKGKRGLVFTGKYKNKKVAIKIKRPESEAIGTIINEARILKEINKHGLGPTYLFHSPAFIVYEFVEGKYFKSMLDSKQIKKICKKIFEQCYQLDLLHIDKQEMTRPYMHAIVKGRKVTLIDFERARKVEEAHNVTQFCTFVMNHVDKNKKRWINIAKEYSRNRTKEAFDKILRMMNG